MTELIAACGYNAIANGVGQYSFTHALILELLELSNRPSFAVAYLYNNIFTRIQGRMPEDGRERHPPPIHLVLTQEPQLPRSIQLSKCQNVTEKFQLEARESSLVARGKRPERENTASSAASSVARNVNGFGTFPQFPRAPPFAKVPRLVFAIRLNDTLRSDQLRTDLFVEWLRSMPAIAEEVKVEAGFDSFSFLIILSIPIALSTFLPTNHAIMSLGPVTSSNRVRLPKPALQKARVIHSHTTPSKSAPWEGNVPVVIIPTQNSKRSRAGKAGPIYHQESSSMSLFQPPKHNSTRPQASAAAGFTSVLGQVREETREGGTSNARVKSPKTSSKLHSGKRLPTIDEVQKSGQGLGLPTQPSSGEGTPRSSEEFRASLEW